MQESAETIVNRVLQPGEEILWTGRPHVETSLDQHAKRRRRRNLVGLGALLLATPWLLSRVGLASPLEVLRSISLEPRFLVPLVVIVLVIVGPKLFKVDPKSRLDRYFNSLTYAITSERLLILEGDKVTESYSPVETRQVLIRERAPGYSDVNFEEGSQAGTDGAKSDDWVFRERRHVGFKALPNAQEIKHRIEDWIQDHHRRAAREVDDFARAEPTGRQNDSPTGGRRVENPALGLRLDSPEEWQVLVRQKKKPQGKIFLDQEDWRPIGDSSAWNLIKIEGPSRCRIEVEVFSTEPTVTFEQLAQNRLADSMAGPVVHSEADCDINGLRGFSVTRRGDTQLNPQHQSSGATGIVAPERHTVLHDGERQVYIISAWPEDSEDLERAVNRVVESIELL